MLKISEVTALFRDRWPLGFAIVLALATPVGLCWLDTAPAHLDESPIGDPAVQPVGGEWATEQFSAAALKQLKLLGKVLSASHPIDREDVSSFVDPGIRCDVLRPEELAVVHSEQALTVRRADDDRAGHEDSSPSAEGIDGFVKRLNVWIRPFAGSIRIAFKIYRVDRNDGQVTTLARVQVKAHGEPGLIQETATWCIDWRGAADESPPLMTRIELAKFEQVSRRRQQAELFSDCTLSALAHQPGRQDDLLAGTDHWRARRPIDDGVGVQGHHGVAIGDANGDGLHDLYICQPGGVPNRLLVQNRDGTVSDDSTAAGVDWLDAARSALFLDVDNDGDQDLAIVLEDALLCLSNDGRGRFRVASTYYFREGDPYSIAAADFDNDGLVDLFVSNYGRGYLANLDSRGDDLPGVPYPYHDANNGSPNVLLRNAGDGSFQDVTRTAGLQQNNRRWSFAAAWEDYDNDGDQDLYVANDFGRNNLFRNDGGRFVDVAAEAGVEDVAAGMSVSWGDYNRDGLMDLYVGNMFSSAGGRIAYQPRFQNRADDSIRAQFQRHARGNSLFENQGDGSFRDVTMKADVNMGRWAWTSLFMDVNNDGWEDLFVTNGFITGPDTDDL